MSSIIVLVMTHFHDNPVYGKLLDANGKTDDFGSYLKSPLLFLAPEKWVLA